MGLDLGLLGGSLVFVEEATEDGPPLDPLLGEVGDGVFGLGGRSSRLRWGRCPS